MSTTDFARRSMIGSAGLPSRLASTDVVTGALPAVQARGIALRRLAVIVFFLSLALPVIFYVGPMRLSVYRLYLLLALVPVLVIWLGGRTGGIRAPDVLVCLFVLWSVLSLVANHGVSEIWQFAGMHAIETLGAYFLARVLIRDARDFQAMVRCLCWVILLLLPLVVVEALTDRQVLNELFSAIAQTHPNAPKEPRLGLERVQGTFEHPILFGVFVSSGFALALYVLSPHNKARGIGFTGLAGLMTFLSLSVGAFLSIILQAVFIAWDRGSRALRWRWRWLLVIFAVAYLVIDLLSNRTPVEVFISYLTFNAANAYNRVLIWEFGTAEVWRNPLFGIGLRDWTRAYWMSPSMDNFWLVNAVRYGLPAVVCLMGAFLVQAIRAGRVQSQDALVRGCQTGWLMALGGICLAICTVHLWNATYCFLLFLLGSGAWLQDHRDPPEAVDAAPSSHPSPRPRTIL